MDIAKKIAELLNVLPKQVATAISLLDDGATVPFIARYRKEMTGGLDDGNLRLLAEKLTYFRELESRKETILNSIHSQDKLTDELREQIENCDNKTQLEDLYLPYKPKRRTKAQIARENGLESLAFLLLKERFRQPESEAETYINAEKNLPDVKAVLDGARAILIEYFAENALLIGLLRERLWQVADVVAKVVEGQEEKGEKFKDYFDFREKISIIPSHRALAVFRGRNEGILNVSLQYQDENVSLTSVSEFEREIAKAFGIDDIYNDQNVADKWLRDTVRLTWRAKIFTSLELELFSKLKDEADSDAISVFSKNLKDLLLVSPAGRLPVLGLDPGYKNGVKTAAVDDTGKLVDTAIVYLHKENEFLATLSSIIKKHNIKLIAIGNGTASRETDKLVIELIKGLPESDIRKVVVSEAGASVYSASEIAADEFPDLDVSLRGAVSIARRLQDPLAELVKIEPKAIGVGQYQHDVDQIRLANSLDATVEDCVNAVGVDLNTASVPLLARISGLNKTLAKNIVEYRNFNGAFTSRAGLLKVPRLGAKTFEQAAGFLRINDGVEPLDASSVHPEAYPLVETILKQHNVSAKDLIGDKDRISKIKPQDFVNEQFGLPTILDILNELEKPGRDPRGEFKTASFSDEICEINDLVVGMVMEGVVSNVSDFGAFVDIGVHQDGLVHISELSDTFVKNPRDIVKAGDVVKVKVIAVDIKRNRISLSMKSGKANSDKAASKFMTSNKNISHTQTAMAAAFSRLKN